MPGDNSVTFTVQAGTHVDIRSSDANTAATPTAQKPSVGTREIVNPALSRQIAIKSADEITATDLVSVSNSLLNRVLEATKTFMGTVANHEDPSSENFMNAIDKLNILVKAKINDDLDGPQEVFSFAPTLFSDEFKANLEKIKITNRRDTSFHKAAKILLDYIAVVKGEKREILEPEIVEDPPF